MKVFLWVLICVLLWEPICIALIGFLLLFGSFVVSCQQKVDGWFRASKPTIVQHGGRS